MLIEASKEYQARIRGFDPTLRVIWDRRRCCFQVQRQADTFRRGKGWIKVLDIGPKLRAGGPTDLGSGDAVINELRRRDAPARFGSFEKFYAQIDAHDADVERADAHERENSEVELVHELEDVDRMRVHVPPTSGNVESFKTPLVTSEATT